MRFSAAFFGGARRVLLRSGISNSSTPPKFNVLFNIEYENFLTFCSTSRNSAQDRPAFRSFNKSLEFRFPVVRYTFLESAIKEDKRLFLDFIQSKINELCVIYLSYSSDYLYFCLPIYRWPSSSRVLLSRGERRQNEQNQLHRWQTD